MRRRRGKLQIFMDMLSAAMDGVKLTHLMYRANLSYSSLRRYLDKALALGFIYKVNGDNDSYVVYRTTEKGRKLLRKLRDVEDCLKA